jgi:hypothetical protein
MLPRDFREQSFGSSQLSDKRGAVSQMREDDDVQRDYFFR